MTFVITLVPSFQLTRHNSARRGFAPCAIAAHDDHVTGMIAKLPNRVRKIGTGTGTQSKWLYDLRAIIGCSEVR